MKHTSPLFVFVLVCAMLLPLPRMASASADLSPQPAGAALVPGRALVPSGVASNQAEGGGFYYTVDPGDTLSKIAQHYGVSTSTLVKVNNLSDADSIKVGQRLWIPTDGSTTAPSGGSSGSSGSGTTAAKPAPATKERASIVDRLTVSTRRAGPDSPFWSNTWVTYYGRPGVPVMGILGEYSIDGLVPRLRAQAQAYDAANGPRLGVTPAFHLIYGMAIKGSGTDDNHLSYMTDEAVLAYVKRAQQEGFQVILDVQIGNVTPLESIKPAFKFLDYGNVHLALDPEFAMTSSGQTIPGAPPGTITARQVNQVQLAMSNYLQANKIPGRRVLIVHQFLPWMIEGKGNIYRYDGVDVVICADGFGGPWPKISKYNAFMDKTVQFTGFKLFYGWDEPLMSERQALGVDGVRGIGYIEVTPNLIIYQ